MKASLKKFTLAILAAVLAPLHNWYTRTLCLYAVVALKTTNLTNADAALGNPAPAYQWHGRLREACEVQALASGDSIASTYRVMRVYSGWRVSDLLIDAPDIGATTAGDVGLYDIAANGGAVVDVDFFGSAISLSGGALANSNITRENAVITPANMNKRIWEQLGLTADPKKFYDLVLTLTAAADAAGDVAFRLRYVDGT